MAEKAAMENNFNVVLIYLFSFIYIAYANSHTSYYVTTLANDVQDSKSITSKEPDNFVKYKNISIHTRFIKLSRISGLSQIISKVSSIPVQNHTAGYEDEVLHLSQFTNTRKNIFKELYWTRKLTSNDITKCSQVFLL